MRNSLSRLTPQPHFRCCSKAVLSQDKAWADPNGNYFSPCSIQSIAIMIRRLPRPKTFTSDIPKYIDQDHLIEFLNRHCQFAYLAKDGVT